MPSLEDVLPSLLPKAIAWVQSCEKKILHSGVSLNEYGLSIARRVGVSAPERIRIVLTDGQFPLPEDPDLREIGLQTGLFGPQIAGITLGHGIYISKACDSIRLLSHECRHVHQYEVAGSIPAFIEQYLLQIARFGYDAAPYEVDARRFEIQSQLRAVRS